MSGDPVKHPQERELEFCADQYRRPTCGRANETSERPDTLGPGTAQMLHLLDVIAV